MVLAASQRSPLDAVMRPQVILGSRRLSSSSLTSCFSQGADEKMEKCVHFGSSTIVGSCAYGDDGVTLSSLWYGMNEYDSFRAQFVDDAKKVARFSRSNQDREGFKMYSEIFDACCQDDEKHAKTSPAVPQLLLSSDLSRDSEESSYHEPSEDDNDDFLDFAIGLERWASRKIAKDKSKRRLRLMRAVHKLQSERTTSRKGALAESLRHVCERISRPSRLFALHLAYAVAESSA